jgi:hypothetical protein
MRSKVKKARGVIDRKEGRGGAGLRRYHSQIREYKACRFRRVACYAIFQAYDWFVLEAGFLDF